MGDFVEADDPVNQPRVRVKRVRTHRQDHAFSGILFAENALHILQRFFFSIMATPIVEGRIGLPVLTSALTLTVVSGVAVLEKKSRPRSSGQISANDKWRPAGFAVSAA